jgi:hypothetical protein
VTPFQQITVPPQDRLRPHQQLHTAQRLPRKTVEQAREEKPIPHRERGPGTLTLQDRQLMPQDQDLGLQSNSGVSVLRSMASIRARARRSSLFNDPTVQA